MSNNLVVVAIPEEQDRVWKVSSEKVPHLTLLFLGDAENNPNVQQIVQFIQHATQLSEHGMFYLDVDRRGTLGDDEADVIFFSKRSWNLKWIKQFRNQLLQQPNIKTAYDSTEQFEEWTPHLTLGYPETPAKEPEEGCDHPLYSVAFDRIAVWTGNYEGPEFRLEWPEREFEESYPMAMSSMIHTVDAGEAFILEHYGIKGMRWGQRQSRGAAAVGALRKGDGPPAPVAPKATVKVPHGAKRKTKIETEGGENQPASEDAIKVAKSRVKLKKSGPATLSNQELREVAERMRLEQQVVEMNRGGTSKFIRKLFKDQGSQAVNETIREGVKEGRSQAKESFKKK